MPDGWIKFYKMQQINDKCLLNLCNLCKKIIHYIYFPNIKVTLLYEYYITHIIHNYSYIPSK